MTNHQVYLSFGSNLGDRSSSLYKAHLHLEHIGLVEISHSSVYETAPWGNTQQPPFLNQVRQYSTSLNAFELLTYIQLAEKLFDRKRNFKYEPRTIDIDILFYDQIIVESPELSIPHPQIPYRKFVLVPMYEIAKKLIHPVLKLTIEELLKSCPDTGRIIKLDNNEILS